MCKQKDCGCGTKGGIKPTLKYCGAELPCTGIVKGDDYSTVLQKIDAVACNGGGEGGNYTFAESLTCPNGGIVVSKDGIEVFEQCYECCGSEQKLVAYEEFRNFLQYEEPSTIQDPSANPAYKTQITHTITTLDGAGVYEVYFSGMVGLVDGISTHLGVYVNNTIEHSTNTTLIETQNMGLMYMRVPVTVFKSNITLNVGDVVGIGAFRNSGVSAPALNVMHCKWKLTKIG